MTGPGALLVPADTGMRALLDRAGAGPSARIGRREGDLVDVDHRLVADRLVDLVRGRVREVGEEEDEAPTLVELGLAHGGNERAGVAPPPPFGRGIDRADADPVRGRATGGCSGDRLAVLPQVPGPGPGPE